MTPADLIGFENEVAVRFEAGEIKAPIHLAGGNEEQLIHIFREHVNESDYVLSNWRSHYHCLLKGVPREQLMAEIVRGRSISLCFPEYRILSSAIVGGTAPIAVGLAAGIKAKGERRKVVCFLGDMAAQSGVVHESIKYATGHKLPVLWVVENNGLSVTTNTEESWGGCNRHPSLLRYDYKLTRPHCGIGKWVAF